MKLNIVIILLLIILPKKINFNGAVLQTENDRFCTELPKAHFFKQDVILKSSEILITQAKFLIYICFLMHGC